MVAELMSETEVTVDSPTQRSTEQTESILTQSTADDISSSAHEIIDGAKLEGDAKEADMVIQPPEDKDTIVEVNDGKVANELATPNDKMVMVDSDLEVKAEIPDDDNVEFSKITEVDSNRALRCSFTEDKATPLFSKLADPSNNFGNNHRRFDISGYGMKREFEQKIEKALLKLAAEHKDIIEALKNHGKDIRHLADMVRTLQRSIDNMASRAALAQTGTGPTKSTESKPGVGLTGYRDYKPRSNFSDVK